MGAPFRPFAPFGVSEKASFFGRERESEALAGIVLSARRSALLSGEAGIGKTSMIHAGVAPLLLAKGAEMTVVDLGLGVPEDLPDRGQGERVAVLDDAGAVLDDAGATERLLALMGRAARAGWRLLFVAEDADVARLLGLEEKVGPLFGPGARVQLDRFDEATAASVIEQTVLGGGVYVEAGLSGEIAADLVLGGPVSPSHLQAVCGQAMDERIATSKAYRQSGGAEALLYRFFSSACATAGKGAERVLAEAAHAAPREALDAERLADAALIAEAKAADVAARLVERGLFKVVTGGWALASEWARPLARAHVAEGRAATARVQRLLRAKVAKRALLRPAQIRDVKRYAGALAGDERGLVSRSKMVWRVAWALTLIGPLAGVGLTWRGYDRKFTLDVAGGEVVARLGPKGMRLGILPHDPAFGTVIGATGFASAAFTEGGGPIRGREGERGGEGWMREASAGLLPLPRGITTLVIDGDAAGLREAAADPALAGRVIETLGLLGRGGPVELELMRAALGDKSDEVRRRAVLAAVAIEGRAPGTMAKAIEAALDDPAPSVRAAALDAAIGRGEGAGPVLVRALGSQDAAVRKRAAAAIGPLLKGHPELAAPLAGALAGAGRGEAEALIVKLIETGEAGAKAGALALAAVAGDPKGDVEVRLAAVKLLRKVPDAKVLSAELVEKVLAGPPKVAGAALALLARVDPVKADERMAQAQSGPVAMRAGAAAALAFLPKDANTAKRFHIALVDGSVEVRAEAVRAQGVLGREALATCEKVLKGEQPDVERAAVQTLAELKGQEPIGALERAVAKAKPATRHALIEALGRPAGVAALGRLSHHVDPAIRVEAAAALGTAAAEGSAPAVMALRALGKDVDAGVRRKAVAGLAGAKPAGSAGKALAAFAGDPDGGVRLEAATALAAMGAHEALVALVGDKDAAVRAAARKGMGGQRGAEVEKALARAFAEAEGEERAAIAELAAGAPSLLKRAAGDTEARVRGAAGRAAAEGKAIDVLKLLAADPDEEVRREAMRGLGRAGAVAELAAALRGEARDEVREAALAALGPSGKGGEDPARMALEKALSDPSERTRAAAARGLGGHGAAARERLEAALRDPAADVRAAAVEALGRVYAGEAVEGLAAKLVDSEADAEMRWAAAEGLARQAGDKDKGKAARVALERAGAEGPIAARVAARIATAFVGRTEGMAGFVAAYRAGR